MKKVQILMSTYNGENVVERQINSILSQIEVDVHILIRDDGSNDETLQKLRQLKRNNNAKIEIIEGKNLGWKQSFMELLFCSGKDYDYYGFSDQDDIWFQDKIITLIQVAESDDYQGSKLIHSNALSVDTNLNERPEQEKRIPAPENYKMAISTEYFQGCGMLWNKEAMKLIHEYKPLNKSLAHDYWVGLVCYFFGKVYFTERNLLYHIRYAINSSEDGNVHKGRIKRIKKILSGEEGYMNPVSDLLEGYRFRLDSEQIEFLNKILNYKNNKKCKFNILKDKKFRRPTWSSTVLFRMLILINRY